MASELTAAEEEEEGGKEWCELRWNRNAGE
jgi:hypothetical protein